jgi:hypothetical protein
MLRGRDRRSDIALVAHPQSATVDEYARAAEEIESPLGSLPGFVAVYEAGSVSAPGISDLDRIAVIERARPVPEVWPGVSERSRYLAMHSPFLVDQATFRRHRWFAHIEPLRLSFGKAVEFDDRPFPEYSERLLGAESLVVCLLRALKQVSTLRLKVRPSLCALHSIRHGLALARLAREDAFAAWRIADEIATLRRSWFEWPEQRRGELIKQAATQAVPALLEALWVLGERIEPAGTPSELQLGPPWSNVTLVPVATPRDRVSGTPRMHLSSIRSAKASELRWRIARPEIPLHPAVLTLLAGPGGQDHRDFRSVRTQLLRDYRTFLTTSGRGYSPIGLALPFLPG